MKLQRLTIAGRVDGSGGRFPARIGPRTRRATDVRRHVSTLFVGPGRKVEAAPQGQRGSRVFDTR